MAKLSPVVSVVEGKNMREIKIFIISKGTKILVTVVDFPVVKVEELSLAVLG